jgi:hypothetical protein
VLVVALGVLVLVIALFALREPNGHVSAAESKTTSGVAKQSPGASGKSTPGRRASSSANPGSHSAGHGVALVVLNNSAVHGLAGQAAHSFEAGGWKVTSFGNFQNDIASTCAYYDPSSAGARTAAEALQAQYPAIKRVAPRFTPEAGSQPLPSAPLVVVLTGDYTAD